MAHFSKKDFILDWMEYAIVVELIISCNSLFWQNTYMTTPGMIIQSLILFGLLSILILVNFRDLYREWNTLLRSLVFLVAAMLFLTIFFFVNVWPQHDLNHAKIFLVFVYVPFPLFFLYFVLKGKKGNIIDLFGKHAEVMTGLAAISLLTYACWYVMPGFLQGSFVNTRWSSTGEMLSSVVYYNVLNGGARSLFSVSLFCNQIFFPEAPMAALQLNLALFSMLFFVPQKKKTYLISAVILSIGVLTSQATLGVMIMSLAWLLWLVNLISEKNPRILGWLCPAFAIVLGGIVYVLFQQKLSAGGGSLPTHIDDFVAAWKCFLDHPKNGVGFGNRDGILPYMAEWRRENRGLSNSGVTIFAENGLLFGVFCLTPFIVGMLQVFRKTKKMIAFWSVGTFGLYMVVIFHYRFLLTALWAFGYAILFSTIDDAKEYEDSTSRWKNVAGGVAGVTAILGSIAISCLVNHWSFAQFFTMNQLNIAESVWRFPVFAVAAIGAILFCSRTKWQNSIPLFAASVLWAVIAPTTYSYFHTALVVAHLWVDELETLLLFGVWVLLSVLLIGLWNRSKKTITISVLIGILCLGATVGVVSFAGQRYVADKDMQVLKILEELPGNIYVEDISVVLKKQYPNVVYTTGNYQSFQDEDNCIILMPHEVDAQNLFDRGYQMIPLGKDYSLYSNDNNVLDYLKWKGYELYRYYPYTREVVKNGQIINNGQLLLSGQYVVQARLYMDMVPDVDADEPLALVQIKALEDRVMLCERTIMAADIGVADRAVLIEMPMNSREYDDVRYMVSPMENHAEQKFVLDSVHLHKHYNIVRTVKYDNELRVENSITYYYDDNNELADNAQGYSISKVAYDINGALQQEWFYHADGTPSYTADGEMLQYLHRIMQDSNKAVYLVVKDEAANHFSMYVRNQLAELGFQELFQLQIRDSYIGVVHGGNVVYEQRNHDKHLEYQDENVKLMSGGYESDWVGASVQIGGKEWATNKRGLNIVVCDRVNGTVLESLAFDTCASPIKALEE